MAAAESKSASFVVLSGGVGGAKLALGLQTVLGPRLSVIANTGDDFEHLGLTVCPDIDTLIYTLAGEANPATGWGLRGETWQFMESLARLGGATWFRIGDRDLGTHIWRRERLAAGASLSDVTRELAEAFGVSAAILPMSDAPVRTHIHTSEGRLPFQDYFVRLQAEPVATGFSYAGADAASGAPGALAALAAADLGAIFVAPSNPWLSIDPVLAVSDIATALRAATVPVIAVSPIVGGKALKGPAAKLMRELGLEPSVDSIARHYAGIADALIIDTQDAGAAAQVEAAGLRCGVTQTVMHDLGGKQRLAEYLLQFATGM